MKNAVLALNLGKNGQNFDSIEGLKIQFSFKISRFFLDCMG